MTSMRGRRIRLGALVRFVAGLVALGALLVGAALGGIATAAALVPGSTPFAVTSGSMVPAIEVGDVVVARPVRDAPAVGDVVVFRPADEPGGRHVTHRVVETLDDGTLVTKGDANVVADAAPLARDAIVGTAEVVVPWVGTPTTWFTAHRWLPLAGVLVAVVVAAHLARGALDPERDPWRDRAVRPAVPESPPADRPAPAARSGRTLRLVALLVVGAIVALVNPSSGAFSGRVINATSSVGASESFPCTRQPTLTYLTGMETGVAPNFSQGLFDELGYSGGVPNNASVSRTGASSLRIPSAGYGVTYVANLQAGPVLVDRFAVMLPTLPSANVVQLASVETMSGSRVDLGYRAADRRFTFGFTTGTRPASTEQVVAGRWHVVEYRVDVSANPRRAEWRIDGVEQAALQSAELATTIRAQLLGTKTSSDAYTAYYDDLARSQTASDYPLGDGRVLAVQPSALTNVGDAAAFSVNGTGAAALDITNHSTYVTQTTADGSSYMSVDFTDTTSACVHGVLAVLAYESSSVYAGANAAKTSVMVGGAERVVRSGSYVGSSSSSLNYSQVMITPPSGAWTGAALNATTARIGFATDVAPFPRWNGLVIQFDTRLAPSPTPG